MIRRTVGVVVVLTAVLALAGCAAAQSSARSAPSQPGTRSTPSQSSTVKLSGDLTIFAAASLTASFDELAKQFHSLNPDVTVKPIDYDGSSTLATQLVQGAPADVFASADQANMNTVSSASLLSGSSRVFASNTLEIAVQKGNPKKVTGLSSLADPALQVVLCAPAVPCGAAAHKLLDADGVSVTPVSEEQNVTAVVTKVQTGNADAGLVYVTDVKAAAGAVDGVKIADAGTAVNEYPIATLKAAPNAAAAAAFTAFVLSPAGQKVLASFGFAKP